MKNSRHKIIVLALILIGGAIALGWIVKGRQQAAAESDARKVLEAAHALVTLDSNRVHVQGIAILPNAQPQDLEQAIGQLARLPQLEVLRLSGTPITDDQMAQIADCKSLIMLGLNKTAITDSGLQHLRPLQSLQTLFVASTPVTTEGLEVIGQLSSLKILDLSQTDLAGDLAALKSLDQLQHLLLSGVPLSDEALNNLAQLQSLTRLTIRGSQVNDQALAKLSQKGVQIDQAEEESTEDEESDTEESDTDEPTEHSSEDDAESTPE